MKKLFPAAGGASDRQSSTVPPFRRLPSPKRGGLKEAGMATHSSILSWKIPWTEEPGRLLSTGLKRVGHDWVTEHARKRAGQPGGWRPGPLAPIWDGSSGSSQLQNSLWAGLGPRLGWHHSSTSPSLHPASSHPSHRCWSWRHPTKPPESGLHLRLHFPGNPSAMGHTLIKHGHSLTCTEWTRWEWDQEKQEFIRSLLTCLDLYPLKRFWNNFPWSLLKSTHEETLLFSHSILSDSLRPHGLLHTRFPCPSPSPRACSNSCPLS